MLHLITVGESSWSRFDRLEGMRDVSLSERGRSQIQQLLPEIRSIPMEKLYFARTTRGYQTAKMIHDYLCGNDPAMQQLRRAQRVKPGKSIEGESRGHYFSLTKRNHYARIKLYRDERLNDIDYGVLSGLYTEEIEYRFGEVWQMFVDDPLQTCFPQGECFSALAERVQSFLDEQRTYELFDVHIGVITHRPIVQLIQALLEQHLPDFQKYHCSDASITVVKYP